MSAVTFQRDRKLATVSIFIGLFLVVASNFLIVFDVPYIPIRYSMAIAAVCLIFGPAVWIVLKYRTDRLATFFVALAAVMMCLGMAFVLPSVYEPVMSVTGLKYSTLRHLIQDSLNECGVALVFALVVSLLITASQNAWKSDEQKQQLRVLNLALEESQKLLAEAQAVAKLGSWSWNRQTEETVWSKEMYKILGVEHKDPSELIFDTIDRVVHPDDHAQVRAVADEVYTTGVTRPVEFRIIRNDGEERIIHADGTIVMAENGLPTHMLGTVLDVTERRRMQDELERRVEERTAELAESNEQLRREVQVRREAEAEVRASEKRFREMAENFHAAVWVQNAISGELLYTSPACERIWKMPTEQIRSHPEAWLERVHPEDRDATRKKFRDARFGDPPAAVNTEYRLLWPDGSIRWISDRSFPIFDEAGQVQRIGGVATDITEQRAAAETLRHSDRLSVIGTLAAGIAHEINNPVGSILLSAQLAQKQMNAPNGMEAVSSQLSSIVDDALRCGRIVKSVLTFSRPTSSEKEVAQLNDVVQSAVSLAKKYVSSRKATLCMDLQDELPDISINFTEIEQVLINLIRNAVESKREGVTVDISTQRSNGRVKVVLHDNGCGIAEDEIKRLFDPFYTTRRNDGGTGLGLSISYGIVNEHGGTIAVESEVGVGTRVTIELPVASEDPGDDGAMAGQPAGVSAEKSV